MLDHCNHLDVYFRSSHESCLTRFTSQVQEVALRARPDIVVATPGRILDHLQNSLSVGLEDLSILVLDEADRLLELGFTQEVHELVSNCHGSCSQEGAVVAVFWKGS